MEVRLKDFIIEKFHEFINPILDLKYYEAMFSGGRGSTKSSFVSIVIPYGMMEDYHMNNIYSNAVVLRKVKNTLSSTVYNQYLWAINVLGVSHLWKCTKSPMLMTYLPSGQQIQFHGCDEPSKIKSIKFEKGFPKFRHFEEFDQFAGMAEIRNVNQSLVRGGSGISFYTFNPPVSKQHWANVENSIEKDGRLNVHSTYLDVPSHWLGADFMRDAMYLKNHNFKAYQNEYLGLATGTGGEIFKNIVSITLTDEDILLYNKIRQGLDFGFTVDPLAFSKLCYIRDKSKIDIFDEIYEYEMSTSALSEVLDKKANKYESIKADSSELRTINTLATQYNKNIVACKKGQDSVRHGIKWLQDLREICIDRKRCPSHYQEFSSYQYKRNKDGIYVNEYPDKDNHTIDAVRYALDDVILETGWRVKK